MDLQQKRKKVCSICAQTGDVVCTGCRFITYCSERHRRLDWSILHNQLCGFMKELNDPDPVFISQIERAHHKQRKQEIKMHILQYCRETSKKLLFARKFDEASAALLQELHWMKEIHGLTSTEAIPTYCCLAEAALGLNQIESGYEYISQALYSLQQGTCSNLIKQRIYKNLGRLYEAKGMIEEARDAIAEHVYYTAEEFGPNSIQTVWGYHHLGLTFLQKPIITSSYIKKVLEVVGENLDPFITKYINFKEGDEKLERGWDEGTPTDKDIIEILLCVKSLLGGLCNKWATARNVTKLYLYLGSLYHFDYNPRAAKYLGQAIMIGEGFDSCKNLVHEAMALKRLDQKRQREWLQDKIATSMLWEGLPGTWHDFGSTLTETSHTDLIEYYGLFAEAPKSHPPSPTEGEPLDIPESKVTPLKSGIFDDEEEETNIAAFAVIPTDDEEVVEDLSDEGSDDSFKERLRLRREIQGKQLAFGSSEGQISLRPKGRKKAKSPTDVSSSSDEELGSTTDIEFSGSEEDQTTPQLVRSAPGSTSNEEEYYGDDRRPPPNPRHPAGRDIVSEGEADEYYTSYIN